ncbi:quinone oxidoreductase family protein [Nostoc punctiforme]|uniref:Alcohol dehydrogenase GroES domain protein n=1 Tax=Nostoc punctiforme (strain ATCC 29133 / PCC 73102) TaxID=63737 RepID=B2IYS6_NOSP7|nr:zinc-binding alcohol dehydrogenase family protein [Nostoc punctiforme]ACC81659.1 Alcohol dehydrogenase GroES domain protein [Nostoc punctiforme PCC 73102]
MMRNIAICSNEVENLILGQDSVKTIDMNGILVRCGLLRTENIYFDRNAVSNRFKVLVKKKAFSCNYRDKSIIFRITKQAPENTFYVVGSDFVGEVIATGSEVTELKVGDRVIANNAYPESDALEAFPGIPSNHASKEYQVFHQAKLIKIPLEMSDEIAAAFSIGGQTSYSIVRKFNPTKGSNILVTAAKSNTSLFVINALKKYDVNIYATSTSRLFEEELRAMGVKKVILVESKPNSLLENQSIQNIVAETGGFDCVFDPFFDLYLGQSVELMKIGAKYITCGLYDQYFELINQSFTPFSLNTNHIMGSVMTKNLQIIGNCLGLTEDLKNAIQDYALGHLNVVIDSVFTGKDIEGFFERTYNAKDRFGKVVYKYE